jgi:hypothetical protein
VSDDEDAGRSAAERDRDVDDRQQPRRGQERQKRDEPPSQEDRQGQARDRDREAGKERSAGDPEQAGERDAREAEEREKREREESRFRGAHQDPFSDEADPTAALGAADAFRAARTLTVHGRTYVLDDSTIRGGIFGDIYNQLTPRVTAPLLAGPVPDEELRALRDVHCKPDSYEAMEQALKDLRVVALCGEPGSGRSFTALHLLDARTGGQVSRLDSDTDLTKLSEEDIKQQHGYLLELDGSGIAHPSEMHLDRLRSLLAARDSYCVLLACGILAVKLTHGRYGRPCPPPVARTVLRSHLERLVQGRGGAVETALATADRDDVRGALGLDELRPQEAAWMAELLAAHHAEAPSEQLVERDLLARCQELVPRQVHAWFSGIDRGGSLAEMFPSLRAAAFRIALAVFNGASYDLVAEAGELLAWELAVTFDPDSTPGRPLFADELEGWLLAARATLEDERETVGFAEVPVRTVRFLGDRLAPAVLEYLWSRHHNVRGPVIRWLQGLCEDPRPQVWGRAALAAGALAAKDYTHTFEELVAPMAASARIRQQLFAAIAADQASRSEAVRQAVRARVRDWGRNGGAALRRTAAIVHGYGRVAGSTAASLRELARIGTSEDGSLLNLAGFSVVQLLGTGDRRLVLDRIASWIEDDRRDRVDLGLVSVVRMAHTSAVAVWDPESAGDLEPYGRWPLPIALVTADPDLAELVADLLRRALGIPRSREAALDAVADWAVRAVADGYADELVGLLPRLVADRDDADRLRWVIRRLVHDPDDPLEREIARRIWFSLEEERV